MKRFYSRIAAALLAFPSISAAQQFPVDRTIPVLPRVLSPVGIVLPESGDASSLSSLGAAPPADPTLPSRLQKALESSLASVDASVRHGVIASVVTPNLGIWTGAAGLSWADTVARPEMRFEIASISKTFTAATIFQLVEEGKLTLDDSVGKWLPPYPNIDSTVTIRELLNHSSGIFDYLNDDTNQTILIEAMFINPNKVWTPQEILEGYVGKPNFKPGTSTHYSNTDFVVLGLIIERVTGKDVADEFKRRFLDPLNLTSTYPGWKGTVQGSYIHGWSVGFDDVDPSKETDIDAIPKTAILTSSWTAGGMVSTASDLARWADALYSGKILSQASLAAMETIKSTSDGDMGLGVFRWRYYQKVMYGHTGGLLGYNSWMFSIPADSVSVAILINSFDPSVDVGDSRFATALLAEVYRAVSGVADAGKMQDATLLSQNAPNPFNDRTVLAYTVPSRSHVSLEIFDALGRRVAAPVDDERDPGSYNAAVDLSGSGSGTYFAVLHVGGSTQVRTMQLMR